MPDYLVTWKIDVETDGTPYEAAIGAHEAHHNTWVYDVTDKATGDTWEVDLDDGTVTEQSIPADVQRMIDTLQASIAVEPVSFLARAHPPAGAHRSIVLFAGPDAEHRAHVGHIRLRTGEAGQLLTILAIAGVTVEEMA